VTAPAFSVVMAAHDSASTIGSAVRSVLAQTRRDFELVIVDDGSRDGSAEAALAAADGDVRVRVLRAEHGGVARARGTGIAAGGAPLVSLVDADDLWLPDYLAAMGAALEAHPDAGFAYTDAWYLDDVTRKVRRVSAMGHQRPPDPPPATARELRDVLLERNFIFNAVTVRRAVVDAVGAPDPRLRSMVDWEWWLRMAAGGWAGIRVPGRLGVYRLRSSSMSRDPVKVQSGLRDLFRLVAEEYDLPDDARTRARARAGAAEAQLAALAATRPLRSRLERLRLSLGILRERHLQPRLWHRTPPPELVAAFGDLRRL
jgi:glycosyltransferase involved in cell wall biosynthesis